MRPQQALGGRHEIVFRQTKKVLKLIESYFHSKYCRGGEHGTIHFIEYLYSSSNQIMDAQRDAQRHLVVSLDKNPPARAIPREEPARFEELEQLQYKQRNAAGSSPDIRDEIIRNVLGTK